MSKQKLLIPEYRKKYSYTFTPVRWCPDDELGKWKYIILKDNNHKNYIAIVYGRWPIGPFRDLQEAIESVVRFREARLKKYGL